MPATSASPSSRLVRHIDFLGRLHLLFGAFNAVIGAGVIAFAASAALLTTAADVPPEGAGIAAGVTAAGFLIVACTALLWAGVHWWCGRALLARDHRGRLLGLALATMNAFLFPLGTLLAGYSLWVLLRDEARRTFEDGLHASAARG